LAMPLAQQKRHICHTHVTPFCARAIADCVAFPSGDVRAPAENVARPALLYRENPVRTDVSARATSKCAPVIK
jgi:hypothetical protein